MNVNSCISYSQTRCRLVARARAAGFPDALSRKAFTLMPRFHLILCIIRTREVGRVARQHGFSSVLQAKYTFGRRRRNRNRGRGMYNDGKRVIYV